MIILDRNGLTLTSLNENVQRITNEFRETYGSDIDVSSNTPDGQMINILAQAERDNDEFLQSIYNSFDPDSSQGRSLDRITALNNIFRTAGTFTQQQIVVTVDRSITLNGLDDDINNPDGTGYTIRDNAGNEYILNTTTTLNVGTHILTFRARELGRILSNPNTITTPVTIILGVTSINNPTSASIIGTNEESDSSLRLRRQRSANDNTGILSPLLAVEGVLNAVIITNNTGQEIDGTPAHSLWIIVDGGTDEDVAQAIDSNIPAGIGLRGSISQVVTGINGQQFTVNFDRPNEVSIFVRFNIRRIVAGQSFNDDSIINYISENINYDIGQSAESSELTALATEAINLNGGGGVPLGIEISLDGVTFSEFLETENGNDRFILPTDNISITIL